MILADPSEQTGVYAADTVFGCDESTKTQTLKLSCTFKNKCNETRTGSIDVNMIYVGMFHSVRKQWLCSTSHP